MTKGPFLTKLSQGNLWLPLGLGFLSLFHFLPSSYGLMVQWPWVILWQLGFLVIMAGVLGTVRHFDRPFFLLGASLDWAVGLTLLSTSLSTLLAFQAPPSLWYLSSVVGYGFTLYALVNWLHPDLQPELIAQESHHRRRLLAYWLGGLAIVTSLVSLVMWWQNLADLTEQVNPFPLGHHNFVAGYYTITLPILVSLTWMHQGWSRWLWGLGTGLAMAALYTTGSRGGALGLLTMGGLALVLFLRQQASPFSRRSMLLGALGLVAVCGLALTHPRIQQFVTGLQTTQPGQLAGNSAFRLITIQTGFDLWQHFPWWGIGMGNLIKLYDLYRPIEAGDVAYRVQQAHCTPMQFLVELGVLGLLTYLLWLGLLLRLGWRLLRQVQGRERPLFYGCGAGLIGYTIASLTDFQLENIGISLSLVTLGAMVVSWNQDLSAPPTLQSISLKRPLSWLIFLILLGLIRFWVPVDAAMMLAKAGATDLERGNVQSFDRQWSVAAKLVPWDPYYKFQLGAQLAHILRSYDNLSQAVNPGSTASKSSSTVKPQDIAPSNQSSSQEKILEQQRQEILKQLVNRQGEFAQRSLDYLNQAVELVPGDELFNRHLGSSLIETQPQSALKFLRQAAQLTPRQPFIHAMLGSAYLGLQQAELAVNALALEAFINPDYLSVTLWAEPTLRHQATQAVKKATQMYQQCLKQLDPTHPAYNILYQNMVMLNWWFNQAIDDQGIQIQRLTPVSQSLILLGQNEPSKALAILQSQNTVAATLLKTWINPDQFLPQLTQQLGHEPVFKDVQASIQDHRELRDWLGSLNTFYQLSTDRIGFFSYRNTNGPDRIELPRPLIANPLVKLLDIFPKVGLLPIFDQTLVAAQLELLALPRPL